MYKVKIKVDKNIECYKVCHIAKSFTQENSRDYKETCALVAHMTSICTLLVVAKSYKWHLYQLDVKNVFLHEDITKEVYMTLQDYLTISIKYAC